MPEYIERESLINNLKKFAPEHMTPLIVNLIKKQPTADVAEVRHGHWEKIKSGYWCSNCCLVEKDIKQEYNYCPNCGAKMDGKLIVANIQQEKM